MTTPAEKLRILQQKMASINKKAKKPVIQMASQVISPFFRRNPSGIFGLDIDLAGGFPAGVNQISGSDGAGKSHIMYSAMAMAQRIHGPKTALAGAFVEQPIDHFFLRNRMGIKVAVPDFAIAERNKWRKEHNIPTFTKEEIKDLKTQVGTFFDISGSMEDVFTAILDLLADKTVRQIENQFNIIAIDSLAALMPQAAIETEMDEESRRGMQASKTQQFLNKLYPLLGSTDGVPIYTSLLFTQQMRANMGKASAMPHMQKFLPDMVPAGGAYAMKHAKNIDLLIRSEGRVKACGLCGKETKCSCTAKEKEAAGISNRKEMTSKQMTWEILKGKAGTHEGKTGSVLFDFSYPGFIDLQEDLFMNGVRLGLFKESNERGVFDFIDDSTHAPYENQQSMLRDELVQKMRDDFEYEFNIRSELMRRAGVECAYR